MIGRMQLGSGEEGAASWDRGGTRPNGTRWNVMLNGSRSVTLRSFRKEIFNCLSAGQWPVFVVLLFSSVLLTKWY